jgi:hypothetical protein
MYFQFQDANPHSRKQCSSRGPSTSIAKVSGIAGDSAGSSRSELTTLFAASGNQDRASGSLEEPETAG